jgi:hypothetical protein
VVAALVLVVALRWRPSIRKENGHFSVRKTENYEYYVQYQYIVLDA